MTTASVTTGVNGLDITVLQKLVSAIKADPGLAQCKFRASNQWTDGAKNTTTIAGFFGAKQEQTHRDPFNLPADEPPILAGEDTAPNPVEHLLNALAGCLTTSLVAHAAVRGIEIEKLESELEGDIDLRGFLGLDHHVPKGFTNIRVKFNVSSPNGKADDLRQLAEFSPVFNTLTHGVNVDVQIRQTE